MPSQHGVSTILSRIGKVVDKDPSRVYVVAYPATEEEGSSIGLSVNDSITFGRKLLPPDMPPSAGQMVRLGGIVRHSGGWRATIVSLVQASAEGTTSQCKAKQKSA